MAESWEEGFEALEQRAQKRIDDEAAGQLISEHLATGMGPLDEIIGGLGVPELIILAARPGVGKTAAGLQIATHVAATAGSVLFLSLELSARVCWTRIACQQLGMEVNAFKKRPDLIRQVRAKNIRLFIDDNPLRVDQLQQRIELFRVEHPDLCLVVIDQLSHLVGDSSDYKAMTRGCNRCCAITKALTLPVMLLTQVGRKGDLREKSRPTISDLKATGSLEEDARKILLIHRPWAHAPGKCDPRDATIIVAKNGDGSSGDADMHYNGPTYTFSTPTEAKFKPRKKKKDDPPPPTDADAPGLGEKLF